jgi:hypothetical protein
VTATTIAFLLYLTLWYLLPMRRRVRSQRGS